MFTGIVEQMGEVVSIEETPTGKRLVLEADGIGSLDLGASIAVNGVCLTAIDPTGDTVSLDVIPETLDRTNIGSLTTGSKVNLERPMPASGRFDGHIVQGHVDGTGRVARIERGEDGSVVIEVEPDQNLLKYLVEKGSITIDGVSLTVATVSEKTFTVALIPHTLEVTTLGLRTTQDVVNLEADVLAKYVERLMGKS